MSKTNKKRRPGLLKWAGGKERELPVLKEFFPSNIKNYYEPFVGGGSVYLNTDAERYYINDLYNELYYFYQLSISITPEFKTDLYLLNDLWLDTSLFYKEHEVIFNTFINERHGDADIAKFAENIINEFYESIFSTKYFAFNQSSVDFKKVTTSVVEKKIKRVIKHETDKGLLNEEDLEKNFKSALKAAIYTYVRAVYNDFRSNTPDDKSLYIACWYFIRNYCYSSMFRFNKSGGFNVPYGGLSYNENYLTKKIEYIFREDNLQKYELTTVSNVDFSAFIDAYDYGKDDFIFLDPPYDTDFSDYAQNIFNKDSQIRLANKLLETKAKWLLVTKHTDFIEALYDKPGINIESFEKKYQVSFKNRNDRNASHLVIRNYK